MTDSDDETRDDLVAQGAVNQDREPEGPNRRCVVTRAVRPKETMLRFVVGPDDLVVPDLDGRLPGRGIWLSPSPNVVETAIAKGAFNRGAKRKVSVPEDLPGRVDHLLEERCVGLIGLARKAGQAVTGYEKVKSWLQKGRAGLVIEASDGSEAGRSKLGTEMWEVPVYLALDSDALGRAFARAKAVHAAIEPGGLTKRLHVDLTRLSRLRGLLREAPVDTRKGPATGRNQRAAATGGKRHRDPAPEGDG
ncbi:MAG: RNA-binding protein [Rhodospirillum sp.]|nr:RNA-binding protein [Rhodospirillum sp.]MCF8487983.1 RNA-binding protein [Rhodospirillum sp.]MCF8499330.1 RNA-binding protein [Rhodospirillum sp.]